MKVRFIIGLFLCLINFSLFADQAIQTPVVNISGAITPAQIQLITGAFQYINDVWASSGKALSLDRTQKYFTPNTTLIINGKPVYVGYIQFTTHFDKVSKNIKGKFRFPLFEMIGVNNKLIARFDEDIYDNKGNYYPANVIAIFTLENGKIQRWEEVVNSKYFYQPEAAKVVYSN